ncbi:c-type cytochrome [Thiorhodococcus fuscus]|uniref:C-type cytochrome n=1 Tax=Thiorhodococcus fuscus TaxID=527200 RepID=A0ABW4Y9J5_9GAMM
MIHPRLTAVLIGSALISAGAFAQDGNVQRGAGLYAAKTCNLCHTLAGESGPMAEMGGSLDNLGSKRDAAWIRAYLKDPTGTLPGATMPKVELTEQEIADLTAFMLAH